MSDQRIDISLSTLLLAAATVLGVVLIWQLRGLIVILMISVVISAALSPLVDMAMRLRVPRLVAVLLVYLAIAGSIAGVGLIVGPTAIEQIQRLLSKLPGYLETLRAIAQDFTLRFGLLDSPEETAAFEPLSQLFDVQALTSSLVRSTQQVLVRSYGLTRGIIGGIVGGSFAVLLSIFLSIYMLVGGKQLLVGLFNVFPSPWDDRLIEQMPTVAKRMGGYIQGRVLVSLILGTVVSIGLRVLGINEFALGLGAIAGVTNLIPFFGPVLGSIPALIVAIAQGGWVSLWVLLLFVVIQNLETYVLDPLLVGSSVRVHPLYQLLAVIGGAQVLGILGALIVPPWIAGASAILENLYLEPKKREKQAAALVAATSEPSTVSAQR